MRNGVKFSAPRLHSLVMNSMQFLFTFSAQIPFADGEFPEISGLSKPLPDLLKMDPPKYLRLYLDMASDLLKWPVSGSSFQVQSRVDILDMLKKCYHLYKDLEHDVQRQKGGSGSGSNKKRNSALPHSLSVLASEVACIFLALFVEASFAYLQESNVRSCVPFNIAIISSSIDQSDLPQKETLSELLQLLQSLWSLRLRFRTQEKKSKSRSSFRKAKSLLEDTYVSLHPQSGVSGLQFSCLLEFVIRLHLTLANANDENAEYEEIFANSALITGAYDEEKVKLLQCLLSVFKLHLKPPTQAKQLAVDRLRLIHRLSELDVEDDTKDQSWLKVSNSAVVLSLASPRETVEVCLLAIEQWLIEMAKTLSSVDAASFALVLHQNPIWTHLPNLKCEGFQETISFLKSNWSIAKKQFVNWLKSGYIRSPSLLSQLVRIEVNAEVPQR